VHGKRQEQSYSRINFDIWHEERRACMGNIIVEGNNDKSSRENFG